MRIFCVIIWISSVAGILSPFIEEFVKAYGRARVESEEICALK